jgi:hypothetical protein
MYQGVGPYLATFGVVFLVAAGFGQVALDLAIWADTFVGWILIQGGLAIMAVPRVMAALDRASPWQPATREILIMVVRQHSQDPQPCPCPFCVTYRGGQG